MPINEPVNVTCKPNVRKQKIQEVFMQTEDTASTKVADEIIVKILRRSYESTNIEKVVLSTTQLNTEGRKLLLGLLNELEELFVGTIVI